MTHLVEWYSVQEEEIVAAGASVYIHSGKKLSAGCYSGESLQCLYHIRRTEHGETFVEGLAVKFFKTGPGRAYLLRMPVRYYP